jgi:hypothetical protein
MVAMCANPLCGAPFRYFRGGKLFLVDASRSRVNVPREESAKRTQRKSEHFWLCGGCCSTMAIDLDNDGRVSVRSLQSAAVGGDQSAHRSYISHPRHANE